MISFDPKQSALLLMDLQNEVVDPKGFIGGLGMAAQVRDRGVLGQCLKALVHARLKGLRVFHVGLRFRPGYPDMNTSAHIFQNIKGAGAMLEGSWGGEFYPSVEPLGNETIVVKRGVGGFAGSDLNLLLRAAGIRTLILAGVATNFVIEGTARQAVDEGFEVIVLKDCCASLSEEMHNFALQILEHLVTVGTVDEYLAVLQ